MLKLLKEIVSNVFKKPVTIEYPKVKPAPTDRLRGRQYPDLRKCIGCSLCFIDCPSSAIKMEKMSRQLPHNKRGIFPVIDYGKCLFCYQCVFVCPVKAYVVTTDYELAGSELENSERLSLETLPGGSHQGEQGSQGR
ncbi:MAG: 4Fe-4S binding protein [Desulfurococcales archaeon]|nr:4Fe-4S binding protein [Desulfurococcales archaeon]